MKVCVFLASSNGNNPAYVDAVSRFAKIMIAQDATLIYGGSKTGLMGQLADELLEAGKEVLGIVPRAGLAPEINHERVTRLIYANDMEARKRKMIELADVFIALPGGLGTFEEIFTVWNAIRLGEMSKPFCIINISHYFDSLLAMITESVTAGFTEHSHLALVDVVDRVEDIKLIYTHVC